MILSFPRLLKMIICREQPNTDNWLFGCTQLVYWVHYPKDFSIIILLQVYYVWCSCLGGIWLDGCVDRKSEVEDSSRVFRGLLLYSSYAFSQIQSACQVRTILYFSANLVESRWGPLLVSRYLLTFYLSGNVYHSWYELFSFTSKHLWALSQHSIILNFFLLCEFARTLIMPLPSCSSSASSLALLLLRNEF